MRQHEDEPGVEHDCRARFTAGIRHDLRLHDAGELPDDDPLLVVCRSGGRSARVVAYLVGQGYPAVNVEGGMLAWSAQGRAVVADAGTPEIL